jgi:hypothetical protein
LRTSLICRGEFDRIKVVSGYLKTPQTCKWVFAVFPKKKGPKHRPEYRDFPYGGRKHRKNRRSIQKETRKNTRNYAAEGRAVRYEKLLAPAISHINLSSPAILRARETLGDQPSKIHLFR